MRRYCCIIGVCSNVLVSLRLFTAAYNLPLVLGRAQAKHDDTRYARWWPHCFLSFELSSSGVTAFTRYQSTCARTNAASVDAFHSRRRTGHRPHFPPRQVLAQGTAHRLAPMSRHSDPG